MSEAVPQPQPRELEQVVRNVIAEVRGLDPSRVRLESNLMSDLGADSLDFLDVVFKLEQTFGIEITRGEMERAARGDMSDEEFAPLGVISAKGLERLRELLPEARDRIQPGLKPMQILGLFSVQTFVNLVRGKQQGLGEVPGEAAGRPKAESRSDTSAASGLPREAAQGRTSRSV